MCTRLRQSYSLMLRSVARELTPDEVQNLVHHFPDISRYEACQIKKGNELFDRLGVLGIISEDDIDRLLDVLEYEKLNIQARHVRNYKEELTLEHAIIDKEVSFSSKRSQNFAKVSLLTVATMIGSILIAWVMSNAPLTKQPNPDAEPTPCPPRKRPPDVTPTPPVDTGIRHNPASVAIQVRALNEDRGQINIFGRTIVYKAESKFDGHTFQQAFFGMAWDVLACTSKESDGCTTKRQAIVQAINRLF